MGLLERLAELGKAILTTETEMKHLRDSIGDRHQAVREIRVELRDVRERVVKLETSRDADRAQFEAHISRFMVEVERAELRLARLPSPRSEPPTLPEADP